MKSTIRTAALAVLVSLATSGLAQATSHTTAHDHTHAGATLSDGEIRKVDKDARKLTIRHGPLENLGMPAMSMVFQVKDAAMLDQVKPGDRVRFAADKIGGAFTVTTLEPAK